MDYIKLILVFSHCLNRNNLFPSVFPCQLLLNYLLSSFQNVVALFPFPCYRFSGVLGGRKLWMHVFNLPYLCPYLPISLLIFPSCISVSLSRLIFCTSFRCSFNKNLLVINTLSFYLSENAYFTPFLVFFLHT